jgi:succinyl-CoA synthetase beta subunit
MTKVQVPAGARGKAGGVKMVSSSAELEAQVRALLASSIHGHKPSAILVEERASIASERYVAIMLDGPDTLLLIGRNGGVEVESTAAGDDSAFAVVPIGHGQIPADADVVAALTRMDIAAALHPAYLETIRSLARLFTESDAVLAEINPLAELTNGKLCALDARIAIDSGSLFRHPEFEAIAAGREPGDELSRRLKELEIQYVPVGGSVGLVSSGAGVGVTVMDWVAAEGSLLAAFVDLDYSIMSGKSQPAMRLVFDLLDSDPDVRSIIVNFTSCGLRLDTIAEDLIAVMKERPAGAKPAVLHLQGNRAGEAHRLVRAAHFDLVESLGDAVRQAVNLTREVAA